MLQESEGPQIPPKGGDTGRWDPQGIVPVKPSLKLLVHPALGGETLVNLTTSGTRSSTLSRAQNMVSTFPIPWFRNGSSTLRQQKQNGSYVETKGIQQHWH